MDVSFVAGRVTILGRHQAVLSSQPSVKSVRGDTLTLVLNGQFTVESERFAGYVELSHPDSRDQFPQESHIGEVRLEPEHAWAHLTLPRSNLAVMTSASAISDDRIKLTIWLEDTPLVLKSATAVEWEFDSGPISCSVG